VLQRFADLLVDRAIPGGLLGPREASTIWDRHLLNCAVLTELIPAGSVLIDVGSGAGLPGLVLALIDPTLRVALVEPMARRADFLSAAVNELGCPDRVDVIRGRVPEVLVDPGLAPAAVVTARAVAPLERLVRLALPTVAAGGRLLAIKGAGASGELATARATLRELGAQGWSILSCGRGRLNPPTTVIEIVASRPDWE